MCNLIYSAEVALQRWLFVPLWLLYECTCKY